MLVSFRTFIVALVLSVAGSAFAQSALSIRGYVVEATGATVPGVTIEIETSAGAAIAHAQSDRAGSFSFMGLSGGDYLLRVPAFAGFAPRTDRKSTRLNSSHR